MPRTLYISSGNRNSVTSINISSGNNISGILNLEPFTNLRTGIFTGQSFSSVIGYGNKTGIEYLSFSNANTTPFLGINGEIETLSNKPNLNTFEIRKNNFSGLVPNISNLNNLRLFDIARNKLTGPFPTLPNTGTLSFVYIDNNQFTGFIPNFPPNVNLSFLHFHVNNFSGSLPSLQQHSRITQFYCSENQFTGEFPVISNRTLISRIFAHQNFLTGSIPLFSNLNTNLELFTLYNNNLTGALCLTDPFAGNIRTGFIPSKLTTFNVSNNFLPRNIVDGLLVSFSGMVNSNNTLGGNLNIAGTNAAASVTGIFARNYLISKNWTVNVNI